MSLVRINTLQNAMEPSFRVLKKECMIEIKLRVLLQQTKENNRTYSEAVASVFGMPSFFLPYLPQDCSTLPNPIPHPSMHRPTHLSNTFPRTHLLKLTLKCPPPKDLSPPSLPPPNQLNPNLHTSPKPPLR